MTNVFSQMLSGLTPLDMSKDDARRMLQLLDDYYRHKNGVECKQMMFLITEDMNQETLERIQASVKHLDLFLRKRINTKKDLIKKHREDAKERYARGVAAKKKRIVE